MRIHLRDCDSEKRVRVGAQWVLESEGVAAEAEGSRGRGSETEEGVKNRRRFSSCGDRKKAKDRTR